MKSFLVFGLIALLTPASWAETEGSAGESTEPAIETTAPASASASPIFGELQIRPSVGYGNDTSKLENIVTLGTKIGQNGSIDYTQYFNLNVGDPTGRTAVHAVTDDGFLRGKLKNVWKNVAGDLQLDYETRLYMPTLAARRDMGMIVAWRNYATITKTFSERFSLTVQEIPILYGFQQNGRTPLGQTGPGVANAIFDNRVYIIGTFGITPKLTFEFPLMVWATRTRNYAADAKNNDRWLFTAVIWPELTYQVAPKTWLGLAYYSDSFVKADQSGLDIGAGLSAGVGQLIFRQTL